jgi:hypothetical protein
MHTLRKKSTNKNFEGMNTKIMNTDEIHKINYLNEKNATNEIIFEIKEHLKHIQKTLEKIEMYLGIGIYHDCD